MIDTAAMTAAQTVTRSAIAVILIIIAIAFVTVVGIVGMSKPGYDCMATVYGATDDPTPARIYCGPGSTS